MCVSVCLCVYVCVCVCVQMQNDWFLLAFLQTRSWDNEHAWHVDSAWNIHAYLYDKLVGGMAFTHIVWKIHLYPC